MIIQNDFLPYDSSLLERLNNPEIWFCLAHEETKEDYRWWTGKTQPKNIWEELIQTMWGHIDPSKIAGFEYWANICCKDSGLDWHQDKDEKLHDEQDITVSPSTSTVYYGFPHVVEGGLLEIARHGETDETLTERVHPEFNRIIIFDPSRWHRVTPIKSGTRFGFQVNIWKEEPSFVSQDTQIP